MTETMLDRLKREHAGRWQVWTVWTTHGPTYWCTRPAGAPAAIHEATTGEHLEAFIAQATALTSNGATLQCHPDGTITATWTSPDGTPASYGPAPALQAIRNAEDRLRKARTP